METDTIDIHGQFLAYLEGLFAKAPLQYVHKDVTRALYSKLNTFSHASGLCWTDLDPDLSNGYDKALYCSYPSPAKVNGFLIASNFRTREIKIVGLSTQGLVCNQETIKRLIVTLLQNEQFSLPTCESRQSLPAHRHNAFLVPSIEHLELFLATSARISQNRLQSILEKKAKNFSVAQTIRRAFLSDAMEQYRHLLEMKKTLLLSELSCWIDPKTFEWARDIQKDLPEKAPQIHNEIMIYNHLARAQLPQSREYRYAALQQFSALGVLFLNDSFWDRIDHGAPPPTCLAEKFLVKTETIKRMAKRKEALCLGNDTEKHSRILDQIDPQYWPETQEKTRFFKECVKVSELYHKHFDKSSDLTLLGWIKQHKQKNMPQGAYWESLLFLLMANSIRSMNTPSGQHRTLTRKFNGTSSKTFTVLLSPFDTPNHRLQTFESVQKTWQQAFTRLKEHIRSIDDMKRDIAARLLNPLILLAMEERKQRLSDNSVLETLKETLQRNLWGRMSPTDQVAASSYWHSPRVDIRRRFESASLSASTHSTWQGLTGKPVLLNNGVVAHPLSSSTELSEEGENMGHCVWSYAKKCLGQKSHIFSLRETDGTRLSTLELTDYSDDKTGQRLVCIAQNKSIGNIPPPQKASEAAEQLVHDINSWKIKPEWKKIDYFRAQYKLREIENAAGYDIRNPQQRNAVFQTYLPCLPRKAGKTFDTLSDYLGIEELLQALPREKLFEAIEQPPPAHPLAPPL